MKSPKALRKQSFVLNTLRKYIQNMFAMAGGLYYASRINWFGKNGLESRKNLIDHKHELVAYDVNAAAIQEMKDYGAKGASTLEELVQATQSPRVLWIMVPHQIVDSVLDQLQPMLSKGDIIIEGGNSHYKESIARHARLKEHGISFMDAGTSGGMEGARNGACYMIGGDPEAWAVVEPVFRDTAVENGYLYAGKSGSGHFLKMVHNGVEYGMMASIGEGFEVLEKATLTLIMNK